MPEGVEVYVVAEKAHALLAGAKIRSIEVLMPKKCPGLQELEAELQHSQSEGNDLVIEACHSRGKKVLFNLSDKTWLAFAFLMTGRLAWQPEGEELAESDLKHIKLTMELELEDGSSGWLHYCDPRGLGNATWIQDVASFEDYFKKVGPDLMRDSISLEQYKKVIQGKRIANKQVADFLMSQQYFAGVGNYLKAEILFTCRLHPASPLKLLTDEMIERLYEATLDTMAESLSYGGLTIHDFWGLSGERGTFPVKVYGQKTVEVDGITYKVETSEFKDKRTTHWVPALQLMPWPQ